MEGCATEHAEENENTKATQEKENRDAEEVRKTALETFSETR